MPFAVEDRYMYWLVEILRLLKREVKGKKDQPWGANPVIEFGRMIL